MIGYLLGYGLAVLVAALVNVVLWARWKYQMRQAGRLWKAKLDGMMLVGFGLEWDPARGEYVKR